MNLKTPFIMVVFFAFAQTSFALDIGSSGGQDATQTINVEVVNEEPVKVQETDTSKLVEINGSAQLDPQEEYRSPFIDTQGYRNVNFFVIPEKLLNEPQAVIRYKLDAFFAADTGLKELRKFGDDDSKIIGGGGSQEFGMAVLNEEGSAEKAVFNKLTTGETTYRVLSSPVYGPYARVTLKNAAQGGERRKFRIVAYLTK